MLILSRVCAEFTDRAGKTLFTIGPGQLLSFLEAPESIREDPLFGMMLADGSLEAVRSVEQRKTLEADPISGTDAEGKKLSPRKRGAEKADSASESAEPAASEDPAPKASDPAPAPAEPAEEGSADAAPAGKSTRKSSK